MLKKHKLLKILFREGADRIWLKLVWDTWDHPWTIPDLGFLWQFFSTHDGFKRTVFGSPLFLIPRIYVPNGNIVFHGNRTVTKSWFIWIIACSPTFFGFNSTICWSISMQNSVLERLLVVDYMPEIWIGNSGNFMGKLSSEVEICWIKGDLRLHFLE